MAEAQKLHSPHHADLQILKLCEFLGLGQDHMVASRDSNTEYGKVD